MGDFLLHAKEVVRRFLPAETRAHRIRKGALRGVRLFTSWHDYPGAILGTTERPLLDWFEYSVCAAETWLDIGAHYGYTAIALSQKVGVSGRVFAFEPVQSTARCISRTRELNGLPQLTVVPIGLSQIAALGTKDLPIIRGMADSTIAAATSTEKVAMASLDSIWEKVSGGNEQIHGIKIDVQGMELDVLLGMRKLLVQWAPKLAIEFHRGVERGAILQFLKSCGYDTGWHPIDPGGPREEFADDMSYAFERASS